MIVICHSGLDPESRMLKKQQKTWIPGQARDDIGEAMPGIKNRGLAF